MRLTIKLKDASTAEQGSGQGHRNGGSPGGTRTDLLIAAVSGLIIAALVLSPVIGRGWILLLDWVPGPNSELPRTLWGLDGGLTTSVLLHLGVQLVATVFGGETASWLPLAAFFPLATVSMAMLVPGGRTGKIAAGLLYALNPMVADRLWVGHVGVLAGYALLPLVVRSLIAARTASGFHRLRPALWISVLGGISPHWFWICGVLLLAVALEGVWKPNARGPVPHTARWLGTMAVALGALNLYVLPSAGAESSGFAVGDGDLRAYATSDHDGLGIYLSVLLLRGFWRQGEYASVPAPVLLVAGIVVLAIASAGFVAMRRRPDTRLLANAVGLSAIVAYFLALGTQGPAGGIFRLLFDHVPGFAIMREPQKFAAVLALTYACFFGYGLETMLRALRSPVLRSFTVTAAMLIPFLIASNMLFAYNGSLRASTYPDSWHDANVLMGPGQGSALFLPWHQYASQTFTDGRRIAQPARSFFERPVIQGDNVELPGLPTTSQSQRSEYIEALVDRGPAIRSFGKLVVPLGVEYVILSKSLDWERYGWLRNQPDLSNALETPDLLVMRNDRFAGVGFPVTQSLEVGGIDDLIALSNAHDLTGAAFFHASSGVREPPEGTGLPATGRDAVRQHSEISYEILKNNPGYYSLREPANAGWSNSIEEAPMSGTLIAHVDHEQRFVAFEPWFRIKTLYTLSAVSFVLLFLAARSNVSRSADRRHTPLTVDDP